MRLLGRPRRSSRVRASMAETTALRINIPKPIRGPTCSHPSIRSSSPRSTSGTRAHPRRGLGSWDAAASILCDRHALEAPNLTTDKPNDIARRPSLRRPGRQARRAQRRVRQVRAGEGAIGSIGSLSPTGSTPSCSSGRTRSQPTARASWRRTSTTSAGLGARTCRRSCDVGGARDRRGGGTKVT